MASLYYFDGEQWLPIATGGGGGGVGPQGPPGPAGPDGKDGKSVEVFGPQIPTPAPTRKGDVWLELGAKGAENSNEPIVIEAPTRNRGSDSGPVVSELLHSSPVVAELSHAKLAVSGLAYSAPVRVVPLIY